MVNMVIPAFLVGGALCLIAQLLMDLTKPSVTAAHILVTYVTAGAVLTGLGLYAPLVKIGGAGATVPLTGFGYSLAKGAINAVETEGLHGAFSGGLEATAAGIAAAVVFSYLIALIFDPKG